LFLDVSAIDLWQKHDLTLLFMACVALPTICIDVSNHAASIDTCRLEAGQPQSRHQAKETTKKATMGVRAVQISVAVVDKNDLLWI
jgi:hypothetical protein